MTAAFAQLPLAGASMMGVRHGVIILILCIKIRRHVLSILCGAWGKSLLFMFHVINYDQLQTGGGWRGWSGVG